MKKLPLLIVSCALLPTVALASGSFVVSGDIDTNFSIDLVINPEWESWTGEDPNPRPQRYILDPNESLETYCDAWVERRQLSNRNQYLSYGWNPPDLQVKTELSSCTWRGGAPNTSISSTSIDVIGVNKVYQCDQLSDYRSAGYFSPVVHADSPSICPPTDEEARDPNQVCLEKGQRQTTFKPVFYNSSMNEWEAYHEGCGWYAGAGVSAILVDENGAASVSATWTPWGAVENPPTNGVTCANSPDLVGSCEGDTPAGGGQAPDDGDTDGGNPDDGNSGDSSTPVDDSTSGSGGGVSIPPYQSDNSDVISAVNSSGRSLHDAFTALSERSTAIGDGIERRINSQTRDITNAVDSSASEIRSSINDQTGSLEGAISDQTATLNGSLDTLGVSIVEAINDFGAGLGEELADGEGGGLLDGISGLLDGLVEKLALRFTEDLGDSDDLFDSSGMDETLDQVVAQEQEHTDHINGLMDDIGDGATSRIAEQVTSRLPSLPSSSCVPLQFGPIEISCRPFNLIKSWLTWAIYFYSVSSIINIFFRSEQRTA